MSEDDNDKSMEDMQKEVAADAKDRDDAREAAADQQEEAGNEPDSREASEDARKDADWDIASDHIDEGGKMTK